MAGYLPPGERLALTLHYLATGSYMTFSGINFCIPKSTVSVVVRETCRVLCDELHQQCFPALTEDRLQQVMDDFWLKWQFPNCFGALDGRHCVLQNFPNAGGDWRNYKGSFNMVLLGLCDANYRFTFVDVGGRGRRSDGGLWDQCALQRAIAAGTLPLPPPQLLPGGWATTRPVIVADDAFPLGPNLVKPFSGGQFLSDDKNIFNYRLSRARRVVENAFGILSARWRVLRRGFIASEVTAKAVIKACVFLHNLLVLNEENVPPHRRRYVPENLVDIAGFGVNVLPRFHEAEEENEDGAEIHRHFMEYFLGPGQVAWQWQHLIH